MKQFFYLDHTHSALFITVLVLRVAVAGFFLLLSYKNFSGDPAMIEDFERWQFPLWFKMLTGVCQFTAACMLLYTPVAFYGGALICVMMVGATYAHLRFDPIHTAVSPIIFFVLGLTISFVLRPQIINTLMTSTLNLVTKS